MLALAMVLLARDEDNPQGPQLAGCGRRAGEDGVHLGDGPWFGPRALVVARHRRRRQRRLAAHAVRGKQQESKKRRDAGTHESNPRSIGRWMLWIVAPVEITVNAWLVAAFT